MDTRYVIRPDQRGYTVRDLWSGEPARLAGTSQVGLSEDDARHIAKLLNTASEATVKQRTTANELRHDS